MLCSCSRLKLAVTHAILPSVPQRRLTTCCVSVGLCQGPVVISLLPVCLAAAILILLHCSYASGGSVCISTLQ